MIRAGAGLRPRICVVITAHGEGQLIAEAVESVQEAEPVELVVRRRRFR